MEIDDIVELVTVALQSVHVGAAAARSAVIDDEEWQRLREGQPQRQASAEEICQCSYHESSHAVVSVRLNRPVQCVLLRKDATGEVRFDFSAANLDPLVVAIVALAGPIGSLRAGDECTALELSRRDDIIRARLALERCAGTTAREIAAIACDHVEASWCQIVRVATYLRARGEVDGWALLGLMHERRP